jgi:hypothetical protein
VTTDPRPYVRVYAVVNWHKRRVHGITADLAQSQRWVREVCDEYGPDAATQTVDAVDLPDPLTHG